MVWSGSVKMAFLSQNGQREWWIFSYHNYKENVNYVQYLRSSEFMIQRAISRYYYYEVGKIKEEQKEMLVLIISIVAKGEILKQ